jgi:hypothetical protein
MVKLGAFVLFGVMLITRPAWACEPVKGYRIPTNVELVQAADLIVLARVVSGPAPGARIGLPWSDPPQIVLEPVEVLKGQRPAKALRLFGITAEQDGTLVKPFPTSLAEPHPSSGDGGCVREKFAIGAMVVAMFRQTDKGLKQLNYPFARQEEDVAGPNSTWVRAVRYYVETSNSGAKNIRRAFAKLKTRLAKTRDHQDEEIARDIGRYLAIDPRKVGRPTQMW